jgi:hypothetical protein
MAESKARSSGQAEQDLYQSPFNWQLRVHRPIAISNVPEILLHNGHDFDDIQHIYFHTL